MIKPKLREVNLIDSPAWFPNKFPFCLRIFRSTVDYDFKIVIELGHSSRWLTYDFDNEKWRIIEWLNDS